VISGERHVSFSNVSPRMRQRITRQPHPRSILLLLVVFCLSGSLAYAQSISNNTDTIRGIVINSVTREPIGRALVFSNDNRFATWTNSEGRFEFALAKAEATHDIDRGRLQSVVSNRPSLLMARKPGFITGSNRWENITNDAMRDLTLELIPESLIVGTITLPSGEAPDSIGLQIFRRRVQDGRARWTAAGGTQSNSDGQFRFADLPEGVYKMLSHEMLDRDPLMFDPRQQLFGYPPVYYENASDLASASTIQLAAGQTQTVSLSLVKQPYYPIKVPIISSTPEVTQNGINVKVYAHGRKGPGFSLGYNNQRHAIEGMLPNGTYTVEASTFGNSGLTGFQTIVIKGAPIDGPSLTLVPNGSIGINVKEEFASPVNSSSSWTMNGRTFAMKGPRRYLNVTLDPADDFGVGRNFSLRNPSGGDEGLAIEGAPAGNYWVHVDSSHGYAASIRSGNLDLQHEPLVVGAGGGASPIEITMRDDTAQISGTVEGVAAGANGASSPTLGAGGMTFYSRNASQPGAHIYCVPLPDSPGQFAEIYVSPDWSFVSPELVPGAYRLLAFDHPEQELEYRNPEAMRAYDSKGLVVRVAGGQKERVQVQISTSNVGHM
jgi:hypothetical protein